MANDLVFNMIANSSQFAAGMKQAQKAADSLLLGTMTNLEKFQHELGNVQKLADLKLINAESLRRAQGQLVDRYDPFGVRAEERARIASIQRVADFRERLAERSGRAMIREAQIADLAGGGGVGGKRAMVIQQLAFAAEDAATQFGTRGLAGALMAAGNNLTFAASMMNPTIGIMASIAMTGAMLAAMFFKTGKAAKESAKDVDDATEANRKYAASIGTMQQRRDAISGISTLSEGQSQLKEIRNREESLNAQMQRTAEMRIMAQEEAATLQKQMDQREEKMAMLRDVNAKMLFLGSQMMAIGDAINWARNASDQEELNELGKKYNDALAEQLKIQNELSLIARNRAEVERRTHEAALKNWESEANESMQRIEFDEWSRMWDSAQMYFDKVKTEDEKRYEMLQEINRLVEKGAMTPDIADRAIAQSGSEMMANEMWGEAEKQGEEWKKNQEDMKRRAEQMTESLKTKEEKVAEKIRDIHALRQADKLTQQQALMLEQAARKELEAKEQVHRRISNLLSGAMDIRSAEAYGVMANAQARSMLPGMSQSPQATAVDKEIEKNSAKGAAILEKLLHEFGRRPSIPVVGLN